MIKPEKLKGILLQIKEELHKAEAKHPKFCDKMTNCVSADIMKKSELLYKRFNSKPPYSAESILEEEIREALSAYLEGDRIHALEELAQCGAVVIRMMDFVSYEIDKEKINRQKHAPYTPRRMVSRAPRMGCRKMVNRVKHRQ